MSRKGTAFGGIALGTAVALVLIGFYVNTYLRAAPTAVAAATPAAGKASLTLQTVASIGWGRHPDWVSYFVKDTHGNWQHSTIFKVPANSVVTVTVYNFDGDSGLRNPLWGQVRGTEGGTMTVDGKTTDAINPDDTSHTFAIPDLGLSVPLIGVADDAPDQCDTAPCGLDKAHRTITFTFRTGQPGVYRWQCFVPCAAGFIFGFGGPMQTIGYMDGQLEVT